ncbi:uncharacterized protein Dwil_GK10114 [Drosophila willistoni]|uniref:non-specific serine/threonine protein kinase n=1 Tax=Drosophila willistoni TaxID=7260 RepID=B4NCW1_DROWI|nr:serine/threonine-protein kinase Nek2 [Drosophila willistoni]EDW82670.1 uncharacterized protein Dwil_GK10114 [Drosophila willistoni]
MSGERYKTKKDSNAILALEDFSSKTLQDYEVLAVMGNGTFGTCYKVRDKITGHLFAWKGMNYDELDEEKCDSLISEINVLSQLQHPNIVQYYHHLVNREAKSIYIVMECCAGGDLAQVIQKARKQKQRFEESYIWRVLFQLCRALQVCHNKIANGTILHRDIKPANIFLDERGNAKLGDFGLARMLARNQNFAASFVGTPHYMSPELVKGRQYDRKSDVWSVGCLIYEMCALQPPFRGRVFEQLTKKITQGEFNGIPKVFSSDLQEIISFMLSVDHEERPGIEVIIRHPLVVRNIKDLEGDYPKLIDAEEDYPMPSGHGKLFEDADCSSDRYSFHEEAPYGQRRLSLSSVFTPDLRNELFYSVKRRLKLQKSEPDLYESIRKESEHLEDIPLVTSVMQKETKLPSPRHLTETIFGDALQNRLQAIKAQESLLQQKSLELDQREQRLKMSEQRVHLMERQLQEKLQQASSDCRPCQCQTQSLPTLAPPIPPRKPPLSFSVKNNSDDTYCSIELNDTSPTVAKLNLASLPAPKSLKSRRVHFQPPSTAVPVSAPQPMQMSVSSNESGDTQVSKRKSSILSLFGLSRNNKSESKTAVNSIPPVPRAPLALKQEPVDGSGLPAPITNLWSKEQKKQAFELLAAMNAAEKEASSNMVNGLTSGGAVGPNGRRHQLRQSVRERNTTLQRNRMRRSLVLSGTQQQKLTAKEHILI